MERLRFLIKGQILKKDPSSPFQQMVAGSSNYYIAVFDPDESWNGYALVACFKANGLTKYAAVVQGECMFPDEILQYKTFTVSVIGQNGKSRRVTNENKLIQIGGK